MRREGNTERHRREVHVKKGGRDWRHASTIKAHQGLMTATRRSEKARKDVLP